MEEEGYWRHGVGGGGILGAWRRRRRDIRGMEEEEGYWGHGGGGGGGILGAWRRRRRRDIGGMEEEEEGYWGHGVETSL